jgi:hypothetical protein
VKYYSLPRYIHHGDLSEEVSDDHFSIPCHDFFFFPEFQWGGRTSPSQTGENTLSLGFHFGGRNRDCQFHDCKTW